MAIYTINLGGTIGDIGSIRYGFNAPDNAYKSIGAGLGVTKRKDTDTGIVFGCNRPKPAQVRLTFRRSAASAVVGKSNRGSAVRFCEPDKIGEVTLGGTLNGKKITIGLFDYDIDGVSIKNN
jgi:hypothetical protein